jgi:AcrR family transcriptional regulator
MMTEWSVSTPGWYMNVKTPRTRRKEARPGELLAAALDTFVAKGFAATRMEDIAARAGVSKGTIYLYYPSKQAIFEALVRVNLVPNLERAETRLGDDPGPAAAQLRLFIALLLEIIADPRRVAIPKLVIAEAGNFPDLARFYRREVVGRGIALVEGILRRGMAEGQFRPVDPHLAARLFIAPILLSAIWQTSFAAIEEAPVAPASVLSLHADLFLRAIAADPQRELEP